MATNWHYADAGNQQQGPIEAPLLAEFARKGKVTGSTMVWREGLANWVPLAQVAAELGLGNLAPPPLPGAAAAARTGKATIAKPASSRVGLIVGLIIGFVVLIAVVAILAAIALPAYQDYLLQTRVAAAMVSIDAHKAAVVEFHANKGRCPVNGDEGFSAPTDYADKAIAALRVGDPGGGQCALEATLASVGTSAINGKHLRATLDAQGQWRYTSDLARRYLPPALRQSNPAD